MLGQLRLDPAALAGAAPLVRRDAQGVRPADRYDGDDWTPPVFATTKPSR